MSAEPVETFLQRALRIKRAKQAAERGEDFLAEPQGEAITPEDPAYSERAAVYCGRALESICAEIASTPEGNRNQALNDGALRAFRWSLGGHLNREDASHALQGAGLESGLDAVEVGRTLHSAWFGANKYGPAHPEVRLPAPVAPAPEILVGPDEQVDVETGEITVTYEQSLIQAKLRELRVMDAARVLLVAEKHEREFRVPPSVLTLAEQLLVPRTPTSYAVQDLLPAGGNALLAAQYKAGKTTLMANLLRAYADDEPFLGRFTVHRGPGRIALFNYEVGQPQLDQWLEELGIAHPGRVSVLHLRGHRLPLTAPRIEDWVVGWLKEHDVTVWIADPFARAAVGTDENSNTDVGVWLDTFDVIKERAGVSEGLLPTHTGRAEQEQGAERARGATRLDDWADVRWLLTRDKEGHRFFRATGRDVEVEEELLHYDEATRRLRIGGGDREWVARRTNEQRVLDFIVAHPGCGVRDIEGMGGNKGHNNEARNDLIRRHLVRVEEVQNGRTRGIKHYANGTQA